MIHVLNINGGLTYYISMYKVCNTPLCQIGFELPWLIS